MKGNIITESIIEQATLDWFRELGYASLNGPDIAPGELLSERRIVGDKVWLIDFEMPDNNDWLTVNQFTVIEGQSNRRPDIVVFLNGLPLGVIELKTLLMRMQRLRMHLINCRHIKMKYHLFS